MLTSVNQVVKAKWFQELSNEKEDSCHLNSHLKIVLKVS